MQSVRFRGGIRVRVLVGFCSAHVLVQFQLRGGMRFIPIGMADISRRLRPQADTAGIGTRKLASTPVGVAERWHPYRGAKGFIRFRDRWYRPDGLNHRLMSGNPTGFLDRLPSFPNPNNSITSIRSHLTSFAAQSLSKNRPRQADAAGRKISRFSDRRRAARSAAHTCWPSSQSSSTIWSISGARSRAMR